MLQQQRIVFYRAELKHLYLRAGTTRLFQAGIDRKLITEATGHRSDALDCYVVTSHEQRQHMSNVIANCNDKSKVETISVPPENAGVEAQSDSTVIKTCSCGGLSNITTKNLGALVDNVVSKVEQKGVIKIKIEIEITKE